MSIDNLSYLIYIYLIYMYIYTYIAFEVLNDYISYVKHF